MAATAEKVTPIEEGKDLVQFGKALVKFDIKEQVIQDLEEATRLEITDAASEKVVRKHRQNAKSIQVRIEKTRLQLNREFKEKTDKAAALIAPRVTAAYDKLDEKVKVIEAEREARKAEKEEAERLRLGKVQWLMDGLECDCAKGLEYNLCAEEIMAALTWLKEIEISAVDYEERTEEAEHRLASAIIGTEAALENRKKFEADQAEAARVKAEQEAEAKRLAEENAKLEAARKAQEEEAQKKAKAEAEKRRQEEERLRLEREALDAEKARLAEEQYQRDWDDALEINLGMIHDRALVEHTRYKAELQTEIDYYRADAKARWETTQQAQAEAAARAKLVEPDKELLTDQLNTLDGFVSSFDPLKTGYKTNEAAQIELDLIAKIKKAIEEATEAVGMLK